MMFLHIKRRLQDDTLTSSLVVAVIAWSITFLKESKGNNGYAELRTESQVSDCFEIDLKIHFGGMSPSGLKPPSNDRG